MWSEVCRDHKFVFAGLRYRASERPIPGSSARRVHYANVYFCERCLEHRANPTDVETNTYEKVIEGATPASEAEMPRSRFP